MFNYALNFKFRISLGKISPVIAIINVRLKFASYDDDIKTSELFSLNQIKVPIKLEI